MIELNMAKFNVKNPQTGEYEPLDGASQAKIQSDWNQTDNSAEDFIKNKPVLYTKAQTDTLLDRKVDKENGKRLSTNDFTNAYKTELDGLDAALSGKVDKETGKGLSTNDFTTEEKTKLAGIESGAQVNVQADWDQTTVTADDYIKNKPAIPDAQIQSDWNQTNTESKDFIKNKPAIGSAAAKGVDSTPTASSTNLVESGGVVTAIKKAWLLDGATGIANGTDLNTLITPGNYFHAASGVDTLGNAPEQVAFRLYVGVETNVDNFVEQIFNPISSFKEYRRYYRVNTWSNWVLVNDDLAGKVDKNGTDSLMTAAEHTKLSGIESGAEVNVQSDWNQTDTTADDYIQNKPTIPTVNDATLTIQKNGTTVGTFSANAATGATINITVPVDADDVSALPDTTKYGASLLLSIDSSTYVVTASLKDQDGNTLGTAQTIDLPLETVVVGGSYDDTTKKVILTLKNGNTIDFSVADLVAGLQTEITSTNKLDADLVDDTTSVHKFVTAADKSTWNAKSDFSGNYNDLTNKPTIPIVDQTYSAQSENAQSGVAIESKKPGLKTTGKQYIIGGQTVTAGTGAEAFNDLDTNKAAGRYSHAEGAYATASGDYSHAEGQNTTVSGGYSHAEGYFTIASGDYSHAEGAYATASGDLSHAEGYHTKAASGYQHVQGKYNVEDSSSEYAFIIGNGTGDTARHNAFAISWNGLIYVNGASTGVDVSAFPSPADINAAITKANAAAPQSTTYTMTQTDTLLDGKLDADAVSSTGTASTGWNNCRLSGGKIQYYNTNTTYSTATTSSSGLMSASDKQKLNGIDTGATKTIVDTALSSTSTNPVQNKAVQAPIAQLIDAGAKNLLEITATSQNINGVEFSVNNDGTITANGKATGADATFFVNTDIPASMLRSGKFIGCPAGGSSSTYQMMLEQNSSPYSLIASDRGSGSGYNLSYTGNINAGCYIQIKSGVTVDNLVFKPMICTIEDYAISPEFIPYAKSNYELTRAVRPIPSLVDKGAKNRAPVATGSRSGQGYFLNNPNSISKIASGDTVAISFDYELSDGQLSVQLTNSSGSVITSTAVYTPSGTTSGHRDAIVTTSVDAYGYNAYFGGSGTATISNLMICTAEDWAVSHNFVPYAPTNRELYTALAGKEQIDIETSDITESAADNYSMGITCGYSSRFAGGVGVWVVIHTYVLNAEASRKMQIVDMYDVINSTASTKMRFYSGTWSAWV